MPATARFAIVGLLVAVISALPGALLHQPLLGVLTQRRQTVVGTTAAATFGPGPVMESCDAGQVGDTTAKKCADAAEPAPTPCSAGSHLDAATGQCVRNRRRRLKHNKAVCAADMYYDHGLQKCTSFMGSFEDGNKGTVLFACATGLTWLYEEQRCVSASR